ncbi:MAG: 30S ribosomal protein S6 [Acidobacteriota bacterium]|nr:30S ribosomal protein S6 [Acidobacteriota bacterium]
MNRTYEIMFIVRPDMEDADVDKLIEGFSGNITSGGGEIKAVEKMGRRRLAYTVRKFNDGQYILLSVSAPGALIGEIERRLRVSEPVIKFITVRMDEEEKRLAKVKAHRDSHVKRSAQPVPQAPQPVAVSASEGEAAAPAEAEPAVAAPAPAALEAEAPSATA